MIVKEFLTLPPYVHHEGIEFIPQVINNGGNEARLVYSIGTVSADSPHKMDIEAHGCWANNLDDPTNPRPQGFLKLYEGLYDRLYAIAFAGLTKKAYCRKIQGDDMTGEPHKVLEKGRRGR